MYSVNDLKTASWIQTCASGDSNSDPNPWLVLTCPDLKTHWRLACDGLSPLVRVIVKLDASPDLGMCLVIDELARQGHTSLLNALTLHVLALKQAIFWALEPNWTDFVSYVTLFLQKRKSFSISCQPAWSIRGDLIELGLGLGQRVGT